jgi:hypothetical protein
MAGRIGSVQRAQDGQTYGFVIYDGQDRASLYLGFSTWHDADGGRARGARLAGGGDWLRAAAEDSTRPTHRADPEAGAVRRP